MRTRQREKSGYLIIGLIVVSFAAGPVFAVAQIVVILLIGVSFLKSKMGKINSKPDIH